MAVNEQQSKSPQSFVQFGPFGYKSQARGEDIEFSFRKVRIANLVSLKSHAVCHGKRNKVVFPHKFSNWVIVQRSCQIARVRKRQRDERSASGAVKKCAIQCARRCQKVCHPVCQTLKKQHHSHHAWRRQRRQKRGARSHIFQHVVAAR